MDCSCIKENYQTLKTSFTNGKWQDKLIPLITLTLFVINAAGIFSKAPINSLAMPNFSLIVALGFAESFLNKKVEQKGNQASDNEDKTVRVLCIVLAVINAFGMMFFSGFFLSCLNLTTLIVAVYYGKNALCLTNS